MIGGTVNGVINLPRVDIYTSGTCKFTGSVTAGHIVISGNLTLGWDYIKIWKQQINLNLSTNFYLKIEFYWVKIISIKYFKIL